jgi:transcription antitermination factor NusG
MAQHVRVDGEGHLDLLANPGEQMWKLLGVHRPPRVGIETGRYGVVPARVPDRVIAEIREREVGGLIELPKPPPLRRGDRVKILHGPFSGHLAIFADMRPRERVEVLLRLLGAEQRVTMAKQDVEALRA